MKKALILVLTLIFSLVLFTQETEVQAAYDLGSDATAYGFTVDTDRYKLVWMPVIFTGEYETTSNGQVVGIAQVEYMFLQDKIMTENYLVAYRVTTTPYDIEYKCGLFNWFTCHEDYQNFDITVDTEMRDGASLTNWAPKNVPGDSSANIGVGASTNGEYGVSVSTDFVIKGLDIDTTVDRPNGLMTQNFTYNPPIWPWEDRSYLYDSQDVYGMYQFKDYNTAWLDLSIEVEWLFFVNGDIGGVKSWNKDFVE